MERYNKLNMIGKGTFGSVWLVESKASKNKYAMKELSVRTMSDTDRHLAMNEVKILSTLKHKNIIRYKDAVHHGLNFYIIMEYAEGGDVYTKIKQAKGLFLQEQILDWFTQLLLALKHIHGFNILHRDLKTQNIFLTRSNVIKLGDFGIARILDSTTDHAQTTVGTPYYLSPEICQQQPYNQKSDMWSLGCVMYEITALIPPFTADCFSSLVVKILHGKYTPIPRVYGPLLQDLIDILLRANPQDRPTAKHLLYAPAMKSYVEKFAVIQTGRTENIGNAAQRQNLAEKDKLKKGSNVQQVHKKKAGSLENIVGCKSSTEHLAVNQPVSQVLDKKLMKHQNAEHFTPDEPSCVNVAEEQKCPPAKVELNQPVVRVVEKNIFPNKQNSVRTVKVAKSSRSEASYEKSVARSVRENVEHSVSNHNDKISVEVTIHQEPKPSSTTPQETTEQRRATSSNVKGHQNAVTKPLDAAAADHIRQSILREHVRRRRRSAVCSTACDGRGQGREETGKERSSRKHTRIQSESAAQIEGRAVTKNRGLGTSKRSVDGGLEPSENNKGASITGVVPKQKSAIERLDLSPSRSDERFINRFEDKGMVPSLHSSHERLAPNDGLDPSDSQQKGRLVTNKGRTDKLLSSHMNVNYDNEPCLNPRNDTEGLVPNPSESDRGLVANHDPRDARPVSNDGINCNLISNEEVNVIGPLKNINHNIEDNGLVPRKNNDGKGLVPRLSTGDKGLEPRLSTGDKGLVPRKSINDKGLVPRLSTEQIPKKSDNDNGLRPYNNEMLTTNTSRQNQGAIPKFKQKPIIQTITIEEQQPTNRNTRKMMTKNNEQILSARMPERQRTQSKVTMKSNVVLMGDGKQRSRTDTIPLPPEEQNNTALQQLDKQVENYSKTTDIDIRRTLAALKHKQALKNDKRMVHDIDERSCRSRDRAVSVPGVRLARARRQAARESLEQHMHHCRRARKISKRTLSKERLDKGNICPMVKNESGQFKGVAKRKSNFKPPQRVSAMVESPGTFKRCETYKVAQFRRLPLMSVPDITNCTDSNSENLPKSQMNKTRHKSESSVSSKLTFNKFKGIRGVQIDKARRRAKKIASNFGVESSRSEFSKNPDEASVEQQKSPKMTLKQEQIGEKTTDEAKDKFGEPKDTQVKFNFRGKTLHLNATDSKSTFACIEALRVFLEENLGTERFIEAYQYLNGNSLFGSKNDIAKDDGGLESILGRFNIDYLPLLKQLLVIEANHFGTSV